MPLALRDAGYTCEELEGPGLKAATGWGRGATAADPSDTRCPEPTIDVDNNSSLWAPLPDGVGDSGMGEGGMRSKFGEVMMSSLYLWSFSRLWRAHVSPATTKHAVRKGPPMIATQNHASAVIGSSSDTPGSGGGAGFNGGALRTPKTVRLRDSSCGVPKGVKNGMRANALTKQQSSSSPNASASNVVQKPVVVSTTKLPEYTLVRSVLSLGKLLSSIISP
mmetsp:Transcript_5639/g.10770  ORF Transcript_5639/g.10770 Transcript_5639/m.10770 type:complete len:221 (-) Transcript_5639:368-1030(-)